MDPYSGKIYDLEKIGMTANAAEKAGMVVIPPADVDRVFKMNRHERRKWAALQRKKSGR
jgi:hypothetical protein